VFSASDSGGEGGLRGAWDRIVECSGGWYLDFSFMGLLWSEWSIRRREDGRPWVHTKYTLPSPTPNVSKVRNMEGNEANEALLAPARAG
jgi:hypothetical protein